MCSNDSDWNNVVTKTKLKYSIVYISEFPRIPITLYFVWNTDDVLWCKLEVINTEGVL